MQMIIDSGRYKVTEVLRSHTGFEAALCCDVTVSSDSKFIVDQYSNMAYIRELLPLFYDLEKKRFKGLRRLVTASGSFSAVFVYHSGTPFEEYFSAPSRDYEKTIKFADSMLSGALEFDLADDRTAACGLMMENAVVDEMENQVHFNLLLDPDMTGGSNFRTVRLGKMLDRMFRRDRYFPDEIGGLIDAMCEGEYSSCAAAYSAWRGVQQSAEKTREQYLREGLFAYLGRKARTRKKQRRKRRNA